MNTDMSRGKLEEDHFSEAWIERFPMLSRLSDRDRDVIYSSAQIAAIDNCRMLYEIGGFSLSHILVVSGCVRVYRTNPDGREVVLYRLLPGHSCVMTATALIQRTRYTACAVAEGYTRVAFIAREIFDKMMATSAAFSTFVISEYAWQFDELSLVSAESTGYGLRERLANTIIRLSNGEKTINTTHMRLASEIGSSREVVSRVLKLMEREGIVIVRRSNIVIVNSDKMMAAAGKLLLLSSDRQARENMAAIASPAEDVGDAHCRP